MKKRIAITLTGTPGTGKTSVARALEKKGWLHLELNKLVKKEKLYSGYDKKRKTWIVDEKKLRKFVADFIAKNRGKNIVIDSHLSHILPAKFFTAVFALRCDPRILEKRLKKKNWSKEKIRENVEAEIIGLIEWEARKNYKKVFSFDTAKKSPDVIVKEIFRKLKS